MFLWDIFLTNEKASKSFNEADMSMFNTALYLHKTGEITFTREMLSNVRCPMNLKYFPHDVQHCEMLFSSNTHRLPELNFTAPQEVPTKVSTLSSFDITVQSEVSKELHNGVVNPVFTAENRVSIVLERKVEFYICQVRQSTVSILH